MSQAQEIQSFDTYPPVSALVRPVPGVEYLFTPAQEVNKAQRDGWVPLVQPVYFDIKDQPFTILARGKRLEGVTSESCQPKVYSTSTGDEMIGYVRKSDVKIESEGPKQGGKAQDRQGNAGAQARNPA